MSELKDLILRADNEFQIPKSVIDHCKSELERYSDKLPAPSQVYIRSGVHAALAPYMNNPDWVWNYALSLNPLDLGFVGLAVVHSKTLSQALTVLCDYSEYILPVKMVQLNDDKNHYLNVSFIYEGQASKQLATMLAAANLYSLLSHQFAMAKSEFQIRIPFAEDHPAVSQGLKSLNCVFGTEHFSVVIARSLLAKENSRASDKLMKEALKLCAELAQKVKSSDGFSNHVVAVLDQYQGKLPNLEEVAKRLNTSARNVRKKLALEGTSFSEILTLYRVCRAKKLLELTDHNIDYIAQAAGYNSSASFRRAFVQCTQLSPSEYRKVRQ